jgi:hypothetical protein
MRGQRTLHRESLRPCREYSNYSGQNNRNYSTGAGIITDPAMTAAQLSVASPHQTRGDETFWQLNGIPLA